MDSDVASDPCTSCRPRHALAERVKALRCLYEITRWMEEKTGSRRPSVSSLLTPREREVLPLIAEGHANKEIARKFHISMNTVHVHRKTTSCTSSRCTRRPILSAMRSRKGGRIGSEGAQQEGDVSGDQGGSYHPKRWKR